MKYAFVDVQNNNATAEKIHGFLIDNQKLADYLINHKGMDFVYLYPGIDLDDFGKRKFYENLKSDKVVVKSSYYKVYREPATYIKHNCIQCKCENLVRFPGGVNYKCNCDVDLTIDMMDILDKATEIYLFTGDGDFENLVLKAIAKNIKINLISSAKNYLRKDGSYQSRLSLKLRSLLSKYAGKIVFLEIGNFKNKIQQMVSQTMPTNIK